MHEFFCSRRREQRITQYSTSQRQGGSDATARASLRRRYEQTRFALVAVSWRVRRRDEKIGAGELTPSCPGPSESRQTEHFRAKSSVRFLGTMRLCLLAPQVRPDQRMETLCPDEQNYG